MVKIWPNDPHLNCSTNANFKVYIKVEVASSEENYELIEEFEHFEMLKVDND
jgi:hypothetical protein